MEKVIQSFKNLYKGEHVARKHFMFILLLLLPAIMSGVSSFMDKGVPEKILIVVSVAILFLAILSIVPLIWFLGYWVNFVEDRLMDKVGIPQISFTMLVDGLKVLPLTIVWSIYFMIIILIPMILAFVPLIFSMTGATSTPDAMGIILFICGILIACLVCIALMVLLAPFYNYVFIEYIKYGNRAELYNPLYLGKFMKIAFKDTLIVFGKFWLVSIVVSFPIGFLNIFVAMIAMMVFMTSAVATPGALDSNSDAYIYNPVAIFIVVILSACVALIQMYTNSMIGCAAGENYVGVYKEKIAPLEETPEDSDYGFNTL